MLLDDGIEVVNRLLALASIQVSRRPGEPSVGSSGFALRAASAVCKAAVARCLVLIGGGAAVTSRSSREPDDRANSPGRAASD